jgi:hypothetical protein
MPRADRLSLDAGLAMPSVDPLSNNGSLNVVLDRTFGGGPTGFPQTRLAFALLSNFVRLVDKSLREYDAAQGELLFYVEPYEGMPRVSPYIRAVDHMETASQPPIAQC